MPVYFYDTGLYHYPLIEWLAQYGEVPGLALLHFRFGLVTSWLTIPASLDHGIFAGRTPALLNGFAFAAIAVHIAVALQRWRRGTDDDADRFLVCAGGSTAGYVLAAGFVNSASPDLPGLFLPAVIVWIGLRSRRAGVLPAVALVLALLMFTVKLSALPVVAATGLFVAARSSLASLARWGAVAAIIVVPMTLTGVVVAGCLLFPVAATCLDLPWSLPPDSTAAYAKIITDWARWSGPTPAHADFAAWWAQWGAPKSNLALVALMVVSAVTGLALRSGIRKDARMAFAAGLAALGVGYVIILAPDLRFAAGYLVLLPALYAALRWDRTVDPVRSHRTAALATVAAVLMLGSAFVINVVNARRASLENAAVGPSLISSLVIPPKFVWLRAKTKPGDAPDPAAYVEESNGSFLYHRPVGGDQCWDIPLPCSPTPVPPDIALRRPDEGMAGGFMRR